MKCYGKVLRIPWTEKWTNAEIRKNLHIEEDWLLTNIKCRKLAYFGHIKDNGLGRIILEGQAPGKRERGRLRRHWILWTSCTCGGGSTCTRQRGLQAGSEDKSHRRRPLITCQKHLCHS
ncbi:hypothetical protein BsWGS_25491 [Bradybaena similaris]